eukprot:Hpha_TRINITY_DN1215_c0_g1::TRINITY_DN1215_c0_g1_i1::g.44890::m.44890
MSGMVLFLRMEEGQQTGVEFSVNAGVDDVLLQARRLYGESVLGIRHAGEDLKEGMSLADAGVSSQSVVDAVSGVVLRIIPAWETWILRSATTAPFNLKDMDTVHLEIFNPLCHEQADAMLRVGASECDYLPVGSVFNCQGGASDVLAREASSGKSAGRILREWMEREGEDGGAEEPTGDVEIVPPREERVVVAPLDMTLEAACFKALEAGPWFKNPTRPQPKAEEPLSIKEVHFRGKPIQDIEQKVGELGVREAELEFRLKEGFDDC